MKQNLIALFALVLFACACSAPNTTAPVEPTTAAVSTSTGTGFRTQVPAVTTRTDRRAPTLAPTATATELPSATAVPSNTPTLAATLTPVPSSTATRAPALPTRTRPNATATPPLALAVYVTALQVDPSAPKSKPAEFVFHVSFLNSVGETVNYPLWRVLIFPKGQTKAIGDPRGVTKSVANGVSRQDTVPWSITEKSVCEDYVAQPIWEREDGVQVPFVQPTGQAVTLGFQVCP